MLYAKVYGDLQYTDMLDIFTKTGFTKTKDSDSVAKGGTI
jgi:hypothetical protein